MWLSRIVCIKCLIDHKNVHRDHTVKFKSEVVDSLKQSLFDKNLEIEKKINVCISETDNLIKNKEEHVKILEMTDKDVINKYIADKKKLDASRYTNPDKSMTYSYNKIKNNNFLDKNS